MIDSALTSVATQRHLGRVRIARWPPSLDPIVLNQTVAPSYCAPWIVDVGALAPPWPDPHHPSASAIISAQVVGASVPGHDRYHISWYCCCLGTARAFPSQVAVFHGGHERARHGLGLYVRSTARSIPPSHSTPGDVET